MERAVLLLFETHLSERDAALEADILFHFLFSSLALSVTTQHTTARATLLSNNNYKNKKKDTSL